MNAPIRYAVMNDYTRKICADAPRSHATLNGDTAVCWMSKRKPPQRHYYFDITEGSSLQIYGYDNDEPYHLSDDEAALLHSPLPMDLPTVKKDLLILMAAFEGNIDRYHRLRRPEMVLHERACKLRGMLHSVPFCKWMESQIELPQYQDLPELRQYSWARRIMSNDLSWLTPDIPDKELPTMIFYPQAPHDTTLTELVRLRPKKMTPIVALISIKQNLSYIWDQLDWTLDQDLYWEAERSGNPHYLKSMQARYPNKDLLAEAQLSPGRWYFPEEHRLATDELERWLTTDSMRSVGGWEKPYHLFDMRALEHASADRVNNYLFAPVELRSRAKAAPWDGTVCLEDLLESSGEAD